MNEEICRLCLNTISDSDFQPLEDLKNVLDELLLNINLDISSNAVMCSTCANNLQTLSNLKKSACVDAEDTKFIILPDIKSSEFDSEVSNSNTVGNKEICRFCRRSLGIWEYISLNNTKANMSLVDMLQKHFPEWNFNCTDELLTCHTCLDTLQNLLNFIKNCLELEEKIERYVEMNGTNSNGQIELNDVQKFTFKPVSKSEAGSSNITKMEEGENKCEEKVIVKTEAEIKSEDEIDNTDLIIKSEEVDIKEEDSESFQDPASTETGNQLSDNSLRKSQRRYRECVNRPKLNLGNATRKTSRKAIYKCEICAYETKNKKNLRKHQRSVDVKNYSCALCLFKTKYKYSLQQHVLIHKSASELIMFKCDLCPYESKLRSQTARHSLIHSDVAMFKCDLCSYTAKLKSSLDAHRRKHESTLDLTMYKCEFCPYKAKLKQSLERHKLTHKSASELTTMFKCVLCPYETKYQYILRQHIRSHTNTKLKCDLCQYETNFNCNLRDHKINCHSSANVTINVHCAYTRQNIGDFLNDTN